MLQSPTHVASDQVHTCNLLFTLTLLLQTSLADPSTLHLGIPTVISSVDERAAVMSCLMLGAIDYMVKPLRQNELRHIWTRVWLWHKVCGSAVNSNIHAVQSQAF